jgi:uncharacterized protein (TIRG00374 family)
MRIKTLLMVSVAISIAVILMISFLTIDKDSIGYISKISPIYLLLAVLFHILSLIAISLKLMVLVRSIGHKISFKNAFEIGLASGFLAAITPSQMGGEPLRIKMLSDNTGGGKATAVVLGERVLDVIFFVSFVPIILLAFGGVINVGNPMEYIIGSALFLGLIAFLIWIGVIRPDILKRGVRWIVSKTERFSKDKGDKEKLIERLELEIDGLSISFKTMVKRKAHFSLALLLTYAIWILDFSIPSVILMGFGMSPIWLYSIFSQVLITLIAIAPTTPGSSGVYEFSILAFYSPFVPKAIIGIFILLWRSSIYYFNLIVGGLVSINIIKRYGDDDGSGDKGKD